MSKVDQFSLDHLNETEFEQFCYDLLQDLDFTRMNWRKGTGLSSSPADRGRDIECSLLHRRIDGERYFEKWFVECKHYQTGVPPSAILGALTWASSQRPDALLIITSNFLSNSAKDYLEEYADNNKPTFKIITWERPQLEKLTATRSKLLQKYGISGDYPYLAIMHPTHIACLRDMPLNSLEYLLNCMDELPPQKRDDIFGGMYHFLINPKYREPVTGKETMGELQVDRVDYPAFQQRCYQIIKTGLIDGTLLTYLIVSFTLNHLFSLGDTTRTDEAIARMTRAAEFFQSEIEKRPKDRDHLLGMVASAKEHKEEMSDRLAKNYELYTYFCEHILEKLRLEEYLWAKELSGKNEFEIAYEFFKQNKQV